MCRESQGAASLYLSLQIHDCKPDRKTVSHLQITNEAALYKLINIAYCCWESWCLQLVNFGVPEWSRSQAQQFLWWGASVIISIPSVGVAAAFQLCSTARHFCDRQCSKPSHSSFDFNFFAFNPWELHTPRYIKKSVYSYYIIQTFAKSPLITI